MKYPVVAALVVVVCVSLMVMFAAWIVRAVKRRWATANPEALITNP